MAKTGAEAFVRRARHLNLAFIFTITLLFIASTATYSFMAMPVVPKLLLYIYGIEIVTGVFAFLISYLLRRRFPVRTSEKLWSYLAVRVYFWSYVLLSIPFCVAFLFYIFAGNLPALIMGYVISLCGLIIFRPKKGDVV